MDLDPASSPSVSVEPRQLPRCSKCGLGWDSRSGTIKTGLCDGCGFRVFNVDVAGGGAVNKRTWTDEERIGSVDNMFSGDRDSGVRKSTRKLGVVTIRKPQVCTAHAGGGVELPVGTRMVRETAVVDGEWASNYVCVACADRWLDELNEIDPAGRR